MLQLIARSYLRQIIFLKAAEHTNRLNACPSPLATPHHTWYPIIHGGAVSTVDRAGFRRNLWTRPGDHFQGELFAAVWRKRVGDVPEATVANRSLARFTDLIAFRRRTAACKATAAAP